MCLAKRKLQEEKQQLAKQLQESKAAQAPQQARLQQMYGELEVARRQLAEGKLRTSRLNEAIQQVRHTIWQDNLCWWIECCTEYHSLEHQRCVVVQPARVFKMNTPHVTRSFIHRL